MMALQANLATGSVVIGSVTLFGSTLSWGCLAQNFEDVAGSPFNDILIGNADSNKILGGSGIDTLDGGAGVDVLTGGGQVMTYLH
jgi:Ca2+-binding RTX toxin-like protein